jgi:inhibitor of KinA
MTKFSPLGENALTVEFSNEISSETNDKVIRLAKYFETNKFDGFLETVPAYASLTIFYNAFTVRESFGSFQAAFDAVKFLAENALQNLQEIEKTENRLIEIPVSFDKEHALDLGFVAETNGLSASEVIKIFTRQIYRVYMLGFLPGFAYMGEIDESIAVPRKAAPRLKVPQGSIGIAGRQTGIYPLASPGGWQIIGKTNLELFTPTMENPTFLRAGDSVKFYETKNFTQRI